MFKICASAPDQDDEDQDLHLKRMLLEFDFRNNNEKIYQGIKVNQTKNSRTNLKKKLTR